jgi:hypothetical protein
MGTTFDPPIRIVIDVATGSRREELVTQEELDEIALSATTVAPSGDPVVPVLGVEQDGE